MEQQFCQSCAMPLSDPSQYGTNADGSACADYCSYCYQKGAFTGEQTMEEMIAACTPFVLEANPGQSAEEAQAMMRQFFPTLKRWKTQ